MEIWGRIRRWIAISAQVMNGVYFVWPRAFAMVFRRRVLLFAEDAMHGFADVIE